MSQVLEAAGLAPEDVTEVACNRTLLDGALDAIFIFPFFGLQEKDFIICPK